MRRCFPQFNHWLNQLPDPRRQPMCRYTSAHLWWHILILAGELTDHAATLYALITNISNHTPERVLTLTGVGRQRHRIADLFNTEKNHGMVLEHVFCANPTAAKNYYPMMQVAQILWGLFGHGYCKRLYDWARRATDWALARAVGEGLRACKLPAGLPPIGQIRFGFG